MSLAQARAHLLHKAITSRCSQHGDFALAAHDVSTSVNVDEHTKRWHMIANVTYECGCHVALRPDRLGVLG